MRPAVTLDALIVAGTEHELDEAELRRVLLEYLDRESPAVTIGRLFPHDRAPGRDGFYEQLDLGSSEAGG